MDLIGKKFGKVTFLSKEEAPEDDPRRYKYGKIRYRIRCECGTEKLIPIGGAQRYRSCGCAQYDGLKTDMRYTQRYTPNRPMMGSVREQIYKDI